MLPFKTIILINRSSDIPIYFQIADQISENIVKGVIKPGSKLPGSRIMASQLEVSRQTIVSAYDELQAQGRIEIVPHSGPVVLKKLPPPPLKEIEQPQKIGYPSGPGYHFNDSETLQVPSLYPANYKLSFNDGFPDVRIAPMEELMRAYRNVSKRAFSYKHLMYHFAEGTLNLRNEIAKDLQESRGLHVSTENILITKGSQMGIFLAANLLLKEGDTVIVGERNYFAANATFRHLGGKLVFVPVDKQGMDVEEVEAICNREKVRLLYITPHHYHPTTVTLNSERRRKLLDLAAEYKFAILEDDYDYDFHYSGSSILPMASSDTYGNVIYVGSLCKTIAPAIRVGFMVAPEKFIKAATRLRKMIDRQGDSVLEEAVAELYNDGTIKRHMKKALKLYKSRRDYLVQLLQAKLPDAVSFTKPEGGMAIWATFHESTDLFTISEKAGEKGLFLSNGALHVTNEKHGNATRLGFASLNFEEMEMATDILERVVKEGVK